jgi:alkylation response protein AidB-like acyl-CoA dehydrogenase
VQPIRFIDGECETNEVFFDAVRTPAADRIGDIGQGWKMAKRLMAIARSNNTTTGMLRRALRAARRESALAGETDPEMHRKLAGLSQRIDAYEALEHHAVSQQINIDAASATSMLKLMATELHQSITQAGLECAPASAFAQAKYLATRAATIYSGTSEVHRNILARAIGCP